MAKYSNNRKNTRKSKQERGENRKIDHRFDSERRVEPRSNLTEGWEFCPPNP